MICENTETLKNLIESNNVVLLGNNYSVDCFLEWSTWNVEKKLLVEHITQNENIEEYFEKREAGAVLIYYNQGMRLCEGDWRRQSDVVTVSRALQKAIANQFYFTYENAVSELKKSIDIPNKMNGKRVHIYGTGMTGKLLFTFFELEGYGNLICDFIVSNNPSEMVYGKPVFCVSDINWGIDDYVFIAGTKDNRVQMIHQLSGKVEYMEVSQFDDVSWGLFSKLNEEKYAGGLRNYYWRRTGKQLDLRNPVTFNEKIQWTKINDRDDRKTVLSDKYKVREWVKEVIGEEYLVPLIGAWDSFDEIDFSLLPSKYVLKMNNGCNRNIIVNEEHPLDREDAFEKIHEWSAHNFAWYGLELQYKDIPQRILIEEDISVDGDLPDYKFFCFNGKVFCSYTMVDYYKNHRDGRLGFFDREYRLLPYWRKDYTPIREQLEKPKNYETMVKLAEKLSEGFCHVRVDLYDVNGKIYFGEMTFSNADGLCKYEPEEFDYILGEKMLI